MMRRADARAAWIVAPVILAAGLCQSATVAEDRVVRHIDDAYAEHTRAVELGRAGKYDEAMNILAGLLNEFPRDYPMRRDYLVIAAWSGNCDLAIEEYSLIDDNQRLEPYVVNALRDCAVQRARAEDTTGALQVLHRLERQEPSDFALARDTLLITIWSGDCGEAVNRYGRFAEPSRLEPYVTEPLTNCFLRLNRAQEALTLSRTSLEQHPGDSALQHAYLRSEIAWRLKGRGEDPRSDLEVRIVRQQPEVGVREWTAEVSASTPLAPHLRGYVRYLDSRTSDAALAPGEIRRLAAGLRFTPTEQWRLSGEVSGDIEQDGQDGYGGAITYLPAETSQYWLSYASFAEDSPVRGRAIGIEADSVQAGLAIRTLDYRWEGRAVFGQYDFTDSNRRKTVYANVGYAYELLAHREQRVFLEWYESSNTLSGTVYFNPSQDRSPGLVHRTSFVFRSRYQRHVDHLQFWINEYRQAGYEARVRSGVRYEQDYDLDDSHAVVWGIAFARNAYDGAYENETRLDARYRWRY